MESFEEDHPSFDAPGKAAQASSSAPVPASKADVAKLEKALEASPAPEEPKKEEPKKEENKKMFFFF